MVENSQAARCLGLKHGWVMNRGEQDPWVTGYLASGYNFTQAAPEYREQRIILYLRPLGPRIEERGTCM